MGPLVPHFIGPEFNLMIALLVGIGFGFTLEQAGFSSTKKLVGLFYGYDFTVLKVFFTAGVTAMIGISFMAHYGMIDLSLIYVNPTFLYSALVGGAIMGAGFIIGGFCPGTSVCAASVGKLDGLTFIGGSMLGIFAFSEFYPSLEKLYLAESWGPVLMYDQLGISRNLFAVLLTAIAIAAFYFTWLIENKVNHRKPTYEKKTFRNYAIAGSFAFTLLAVVAFAPSKNEIIENKIALAKEQKKCVFKMMTADKLASEISNNYYKLNIIDVRTKEEFEQYHLPLAINIPANEILNREWEAIFKQNIRSNVFYANTDTLAKMACLKAKFAGRSENFVLAATPDEFHTLFYQPTTPGKSATKAELNVYNFRTKAAQEMDEIVASLKNASKPVKKVVKKASGGCS